MADIVSLLGQVPLFASLSPAELGRLANDLRAVTVPSGEILFHEGDHGDHFYIVVEGQLEIVKALGTHDERQIAMRERGEFVGEMSLFSQDGLRTASVCTHGSVQLLVLTRDDFNALLRRQPLLAYEMVRVMSTRLNAAHNVALRDLIDKNNELTQAYEQLRAAQQQIIEKERLEHELHVAYDIQMSLLPQQMPQLAGFDFGARLVPARTVGGDLFDFIPFAPGKVGVVIGDVTDKGVPAAIFMAQAHALLHAAAGKDISPRQVLSSTNFHLMTMNFRGMFVTAIYGILDGATGEFRYARAGHESPVVITAQGELLQPEPDRSTVLGLWDQPLLDEQTVTIPPGGSLLLYTDGVTDARDPAGRLMGAEGLRAMLLLRTNHGLPAQALCDSLLDGVMQLCASCDQSDDITLVAIRNLQL